MAKHKKVVHYHQGTLEFAWGFPTPSRFPAQSLAVIDTFWLGLVWHFPNPLQIPGIVPIAKNPYPLLLGSFA
jgi:hypothetical protein